MAIATTDFRNWRLLSAIGGCILLFMNPTKTPTDAVTFEKSQPKKSFVWMLRCLDGSFDKRRMTLADYRELVRTIPAGRPLAGLWKYEEPGEGGIYPTMTEWKRIHSEGRCAGGGQPCEHCAANGYDALTGKTVAR